MSSDGCQVVSESLSLPSHPLTQFLSQDSLLRFIAPNFKKEGFSGGHELRQAQDPIRPRDLTWGQALKVINRRAVVEFFKSRI